MKLLRGILGIFCLGGAVLTNQGAAAPAQISSIRSDKAPAGPQLSTNFVLELDGTDSYVELPPTIFNDLDEARGRKHLNSEL